MYKEKKCNQIPEDNWIDDILKHKTTERIKKVQ